MLVARETVLDGSDFARERDVVGVGGGETRETGLDGDTKTRSSERDVPLGY